MIWLTWRQSRAQALTVVTLLVAAAIVFLISGLQMHHDYAADLAACTRLDNCDTTFSDFQRSYSAPLVLVQLLMIATPALIGIFCGAPLIAREMETGTHQLAWNQTVTRTRWLAVKLAVVGIASLATTGILSYLLTWWAGPLDHLTGNRFAPLTFISRDIVPLGHAAFTFALGTTVGLLIRRTLPAMAITLAVFIGIQVLIPTVIRPHILPATTVTFPINQSTGSRAQGVEISNSQGEVHFGGLPVPQGAWLISTPPMETSSGQAFSADVHPDCFPGLDSNPAPAQGNPFEQIGACLAKYDLHETITYQPASRYWPLQWIETGTVAALAAALAAFCFMWIRRRRN